MVCVPKGQYTDCRKHRTFCSQIGFALVGIIDTSCVCYLFHFTDTTKAMYIFLQAPKRLECPDTFTKPANAPSMMIKLLVRLSRFSSGDASSTDQPVLVAHDVASSSIVSSASFPVFAFAFVVLGASAVSLAPLTMVSQSRTHQSSPPLLPAP